MRFVPFALIIAALLPFTAAARVPGDTYFPVAVSIFNDARAPQTVLFEAQEVATSVMRTAGIALDWIDCGAPGARITDSGCAAIAYPRHFSVRLIPAVNPRKGDIFGESIQDEAGVGGYALVYYAGMAGSDSTRSVRLGKLLGLVVAHELGHLLLGRNSHADCGLMAAVWQADELQLAAHGRLLFSAEEADRMHQRYLAAGVVARSSQKPRFSEGGK